MADPQSVAGLSRLYRARYPIAHRLELSLAGRGFVVETNSAALHEELRTYYAEFLASGPLDEAEPAPIVISAFQGDAPSFATEFTVPPLERGKKRLKETYLETEDGRLVHKVRTGMKFAFGGDLERGGEAAPNLAMGPCEANPNQVVNFVNNRLMSWLLDQGCELAHAAAVARPSGAAVCIAGFSGMGKSTTSLHLMSAAPLVFISNDRVLMKKADDGGPVDIFGVPKHPRINPGTALNNPDLIKIMTAQEKAEFSRLAPEELWEVEHKYDAIVEECYGPGRFELQAKMVAFVVLNWHHGAGEPKIERFAAKDRPDLLEAIMKSPGLFHHPGRAIPEPRVEHYIEVLSETPIVEIAGGVDFEAAANYCLGLLEESEGTIGPR